MPNYNPNLDNLKSYQPKWKSGKTRTIRVPIAIAEQILEVARQLDKGISLDTSKSIAKGNQTTSQKFNSNKTNYIIDTSDINREEIRKILLQAFEVRSNQGAKIKTKLSELGQFFGWKIEKANKNASWTITDTSE